MAVPKRKKGRSATNHRRTHNDKLPTAARSTCPRCGATRRPHHVCGNCGFYKDREVIVTE